MKLGLNALTQESASMKEFNPQTRIHKGCQPFMIMRKSQLPNALNVSVSASSSQEHSSNSTNHVRTSLLSNL